MRRFVFLSLLGLMTSCPGSLVLRVEMFPLSEELVPSFDQIEVEWVSPSDQDRFTLDAGGSTLPLAFELLFPASVRGELIQFTVRGLTQAGEQAVWQADFLAEPGTTVQVFAEFCGDGVLQPELGEECDDGSQNSNAQPGACRVTCEIAFCGDGVLDQGEECDDANLIEGDGCDSNCSFPACQNGIASPGELCLLVQSELNGLPNPFRVITLDATGNGSLDLVVLHPTFNTIRFYKNLGGGSFALASDFTLSGFVNDIASFNFTEDEKEELALIVSSASGEDIVIFELTENDELQEILSVASPNAERLAIADIEGDGDSDLITTHPLLDTVTIFTNTGNNSFVPSAPVPTGNFPLALRVGDVNGDELVDVLTADGAAGSLSLLINNGGNDFSLSSIPILQSTLFFDLGDFDGDGDLDIAGSHSSINQIEVLINLAGNFSRLTTLATGNTPENVIVSDLNNDGLPELSVINNDERSVSVFINQGGAQFSELLNEQNQVLRFPVGSFPSSIITSDINGDRALDIIVSTAATTNLIVSRP